MSTFTPEQIEQAYDASSEKIRSLIEGGVLSSTVLELQSEGKVTPEKFRALLLDARNTLINLVPQEKFSSMYSGEVIASLEKKVFGPAGLKLQSSDKEMVVAPSVAQEAKIAAPKPATPPVNKPTAPSQQEPAAVLPPVEKAVTQVFSKPAAPTSYGTDPYREPIE